MYKNKINTNFFKKINKSINSTVEMVFAITAVLIVKYIIIFTYLKKIQFPITTIDWGLVLNLFKTSDNFFETIKTFFFNNWSETNIPDIKNIINFENKIYFFIHNLTSPNYIILYIYIFLIIFLFLLLVFVCFFYQFFSKLVFIQIFNKSFTFLFFISIWVNNMQTTHVINLDFNFLLNQQNISFYPFSFEFSNTSNFFSTTTIQIAYFCNLFSVYYMKKEIKIEKFLLFLNFFVFSMIFFIHANNIIIMFFFWEFIGITSFFLINFYDLRPITFKSAFKAFSFNRFSDVNFLTAIAIYISTTNNVAINSENLNNFLNNNTQLNLLFFNIKSSTLFSVFIVLAAFCKSAQLGFHYWLPDSMEAPATASALIHSATLVSSGIYLILKFKELIISNEYLLYFVVIISAITAIFGSVVSSCQTDLKKILAYSTISNCGTLIVSLFTTNLTNSLNYFYFHGISKSLCFLFVGYFIIQSNHQQDLRKIGSSNKIDNQIKILLSFTLIVLAAWPITLLSLFKHNIVISNYNVFLFTIVSITASSIFSTVYSFKISYFLLQTSNKSNKSLLKKNEEFCFSTKILINYFLFFCFCIFIKHVYLSNVTSGLISAVIFYFNLKILLYVFFSTIVLLYTYIKSYNSKTLSIYYVITLLIILIFFFLC